MHCLSPLPSRCRSPAPPLSPRQRASRALGDSPDLEGVASQAISALGLSEEEEAAAEAAAAAARAAADAAALDAESLGASETQLDGMGGQAASARVDTGRALAEERAVRRAMLLSMGASGECGAWGRRTPATAYAAACAAGCAAACAAACHAAALEVTGDARQALRS